MKKSILSFSGIVMLFIVLFSCTEEQESVRIPDEAVNLKGEVTKEKQEADERGVFKVTEMLTILHSYIKLEVSEDYTYYEDMPERKETNWYFDNFKRKFKSGSETDNWVLDKIESGEIFIFGTTVKEVKLAVLVFSEGLDVPEQYLGKSGFVIDTDISADCKHEIPTGIGRRGACNCLIMWSCYNFGRCGECSDKENINLEDLFDIDQWIINDYDFEKFGGLPLSEINIGDPVLQLKRK